MEKDHLYFFALNFLILLFVRTIIDQKILKFEAILGNLFAIFRIKPIAVAGVGNDRNTDVRCSDSAKVAGEKQK